MITWQVDGRKSDGNIDYQKVNMLKLEKMYTTHPINIIPSRASWHSAKEKCSMRLFPGLTGGQYSEGMELRHLYESSQIWRQDPPHDNQATKVFKIVENLILLNKHSVKTS